MSKKKILKQSKRKSNKNRKKTKKKIKNGYFIGGMMSNKDYSRDVKVEEQQNAILIEYEPLSIKRGSFKQVYDCSFIRSHNERTNLVMFPENDSVTSLDNRPFENIREILESGIELKYFEILRRDNESSIDFIDNAKTEQIYQNFYANHDLAPCMYLLQVVNRNKCIGIVDKCYPEHIFFDNNLETNLELLMIIYEGIFKLSSLHNTMLDDIKFENTCMIGKKIWFFDFDPKYVYEYDPADFYEILETEYVYQHFALYMILRYMIQIIKLGETGQMEQISRLFRCDEEGFINDMIKIIYFSLNILIRYVYNIDPTPKKTIQPYLQKIKEDLNIIQDFCHREQGRCMWKHYLSIWVGDENSGESILQAEQPYLINNVIDKIAELDDYGDEHSIADDIINSIFK